MNAPTMPRPRSLEDQHTPRVDLTGETDLAASLLRSTTQGLRPLLTTTQVGENLVQGFFPHVQAAYEPAMTLRELEQRRKQLVQDISTLDARRSRKQEALAALEVEVQRTQDKLAALHRHIDMAATAGVAAAHRPYLPETSPHLAALEWVKAATHDLADERLAALLGVSRQTLHHWRQGEPIRSNNRRRLLAVRDVLERAADRVGTGAPLAVWLDAPYRADGHTPAQLLATGEIDEARLVAIGELSPNVMPPPVWVKTAKSPEREGTLTDALPPWYERSVPGLADEGDDETRADAEPLVTARGFSS